MHRLALFVVLASGCVQTASNPCADGTICAEGTSCATIADSSRCIAPDQRTACDGAGSACTNEGGVCRDSSAGKVCIVATCGDDIIDAPEVCDDGNRVDQDGCSATCASDETCGNRVTDLSLGEQCDDGPPTLAGDGCDATCGTEFRVWRDVTPDPPVRWNFGFARDPFLGTVLVGGGSEATVNITTSHAASSIFGDTFRWFAGGSHLIPAMVTAPRRARASVAYDPKSGRVLQYGGFGSNEQRNREMWAWNGITWTQVPMPTMNDPGPRTDAAFACSPTRCILVGGLTGAEAIFSNATYAWDGTTWTVLNGQSAGFADRAGATLAYHAELGQFVLFGGDTPLGPAIDSWTLADGQTVWTLRATGNPIPRSPTGPYPSSAYDEEAKKIVLVTERRTYTYNGSWTATGATGDFPGAEASLAWDPTRRRVIALGRLSTSVELVAFEWTGTQWSRTDVGIGAGSVSQVGTYDERKGELVVIDDTNGPLAWDSIGWARLPSAGLVSDKQSRLAYDTTCGRVLAFGGLETMTGAPSSALQELTETGWTTLPAPSGPTARADHAMAYDRGRERLVVFGGPGLDDLWVHTGCGAGEWTQVPRTDPWPAARSRATLTYDRKRDRLILFGGAGANNAFLGDTWELVGETWREITSATTPSARTRHSAAYDPRTGRIILFGGRSADGVSAETWELEGDIWKLVATVTLLNAREGSMLEQDRTGFVVSLGGNSQGGTLGLTMSRLHSELDISKVERCIVDVDGDGDGLAGCADPDCTGRCAPTCTYDATCSGPHCGDGACNLPLEDPWICPADC